MVRFLRSLAILLLLYPLSAFGQEGEPRRIHVKRISGDITVDGAMDEAVWDEADVAANF